MDMENEASWAMDQLRAANKASDEGKFLAKQQQQYVSQFRIDGQPILPPLMTADRRQQMWQLKQRALQLEAKYKQQAQCDTSSSSNTSSMSTVQRILPQQQRLQQTPTYIYDSTQQDALLETPRSRPQTLQLKSGSSNSSNNSCGSNKNCGSNTNCGIPSICVNPPTPLEPNPSLSLSPSANASRLQLGHTRRKLNNITSRIMRFERQTDNEALPLQVLWQDKRMLRSSTSPALLLPQPEASGQQMQRSRSFTLDEPSPALLAHMQRVGQQQMEQEQQQQQQQQAATTVTATSPRNPRLVHATQSLAHLRRDTIESKAKQVQRSASSSLVSATTATSRRCGGNSPQRSLQQQQQYLKQLLQRALHEADDVCDEQSQQERKHLTLAKRQMFKDIKLAHRDRFQQLVQYQHEEQRRMQAEFDRQQKFLIEQICADINVAVYANASTSPQAATTAASSLAAPTSSASACTSTADLSPNCTSTARKRLFDGADTESDVPSEMLPLDSVATTKSQPTANHNNSNNNSSNSSVSNKSKLKKSQQLQQQRKLSSPVPKTPPARRVINKTTTSSVGRTKPQQQQQTTTTSLSKTRRAASPSRQSQRFVAKK
ncbi:uncharacterized protein LOC132796098 isoform X2 [Drosophila nasuta]|uniref:uncharacterized protein LOC132796098 isoform X2 n=1 Tax=Drosophila nasuta TaxID=42062 RepID=UPI00295EC03B|nr:uncharacterized protein LOC132796098 isoform X2 [Drosophila nasuta]